MNYKLKLATGFSTFLLISILSCSQQAQETKAQTNISESEKEVKAIENELSKEGIKGNVKSVIELIYGGPYSGLVTTKNTYMFNKQGNYSEIVNLNYKTLTYRTGIDTILESKSVDKYNANGNKIETVKYNQEGKIEDRYVYKYDDKGNKVEYLKFKGDATSMSDKTVNKYDSKGNCIESIDYFFEIQHWTRDNQGKYIPTTEYNPQGYIRGKKIKKFDENGNMIEEASYGAVGNLGSQNYGVEQKLESKKTLTYQYDSNNNKIVETAYWENTQEGFVVKAKSVEKYDNKGNKIEYIEYMGDGSLAEQAKLTYDANGNLIESIEYDYEKGGKITGDVRVSKKSKKYDDKGNLVEVKYANNSSSNIEYEYDNSGNWIKKTELVGQQTILTKREIIYY